MLDGMSHMHNLDSLDNLKLMHPCNKPNLTGVKKWSAEIVFLGADDAYVNRVMQRAPRDFIQHRDTARRSWSV